MSEVRLGASGTHREVGMTPAVGSARGLRAENPSCPEVPSYPAVTYFPCSR